MIGYLQGIVQAISEKSILLLVQGVGYEVFIPPNLFDDMKEGREISLFTHAVYREDEASLYGFDTVERRDFFRLLITVNGVGARMGMELMSLPLDRLGGAIAHGDEAYLTTVKGVGAKLASRIVLELKNKISDQRSAISDQPRAHPALEDAIVALEQLGYDRKHIRRALRDIPGDITATEDVVRWGLQHL